MAIVLRTLLIVVCMIVGAFLDAQINIYAGASGNLVFLANIATYIVYLAVGVTLGTMFNPRFTKNKQKMIYIIPIAIFVIIGVTPLLNLVMPALSINRFTKYLRQFTYLAWAIVGMFCSLVFR